MTPDLETGGREMVGEEVLAFEELKVIWFWTWCENEWVMKCHVSTDTITFFFPPFCCLTMSIQENDRVGGEGGRYDG